MGGSQSQTTEVYQGGCCSRCSNKPAKEPPPPGLCGYWFQNALAVEHKLGTIEARRALGLPSPPDGPFAWAIVDDRARSLEWVVGEVVNGQGVPTLTVKEKVSQWLADEWVIPSRDSLTVSNREYIDIDGRRVVTSITVSGIKLHRAFAAMVNQLPVRLILSEARRFGWERQCLEACLMEINRTMEMRAQRMQKRSSMRQDRLVDSSMRPDESSAASPRAAAGQAGDDPPLFPGVQVPPSSPRAEANARAATDGGAKYVQGLAGLQAAQAAAAPSSPTSAAEGSSPGSPAKDAAGRGNEFGS